MQSRERAPICSGKLDQMTIRDLLGSFYPGRKARSIVIIRKEKKARHIGFFQS